MGARIEATEGRFPPFTLHGSALHGIDYELPVASAQVKSCVLLAGLAADGATVVREPLPTRDHTERMLLGAGVPLEREPGRICLTNVDELEPEAFDVPADPSSAAFLAAAALPVRRSHIG